MSRYAIHNSREYIECIHRGSYYECRVSYFYLTNAKSYNFRLGENVTDVPGPLPDVPGRPSDVPGPPSDVPGPQPAVPGPQPDVPGHEPL